MEPGNSAGSSTTTVPTPQSPAPSTGTSDVSVQEEFEAYKLKTKEWQKAVKERDLKLREQLKASTDRLREQDAQLDAQSKRIAELESQLAVSDRKLAETDRVADQSVRIAIEGLKRTHEAEIAEMYNTNKKLKDIIDGLQKELQVERRYHDGTSFFHSKHDHSNNAIDILYSVKLRHPTTNVELFYCLARNSWDELRWFEESLLQRLWNKYCLGRQLLLPPTPDRILEEKLKEQEVLLKSKASLKEEETLNELKKQEEQRKVTATSRLREELKEVEQELAAVKAQRHQLSEALQEEKEKVKQEHQYAIETAFLAEKHQSELAQLKSETAKTIEHLQERVKDLEDYKTKAQLALKRSKTAAGPSTTPNGATGSSQPSGLHLSQSTPALLSREQNWTETNFTVGATTAVIAGDVAGGSGDVNPEDVGGFGSPRPLPAAGPSRNQASSSPNTSGAALLTVLQPQPAAPPTDVLENSGNTGSGLLRPDVNPARISGWVDSTAPPEATSSVTWPPKDAFPTGPNREVGCQTEFSSVTLDGTGLSECSPHGASLKHLHGVSREALGGEVNDSPSEATEGTRQESAFGAAKINLPQAVPSGTRPPRSRSNSATSATPGGRPRSDSATSMESPGRVPLVASMLASANDFADENIFAERDALIEDLKKLQEENQQLQQRNNVLKEELASVTDTLTRKFLQDRLTDVRRMGAEIESLRSVHGVSPRASALRGDAFCPTNSTPMLDPSSTDGTGTAGRPVFVDANQGLNSFRSEPAHPIERKGTAAPFASPSLSGSDRHLSVASVGASLPSGESDERKRLEQNERAEANQVATAASGGAQSSGGGIFNSSSSNAYQSSDSDKLKTRDSRPTTSPILLQAPPTGVRSPERSKGATAGRTGEAGILSSGETIPRTESGDQVSLSATTANLESLDIPDVSEMGLGSVGQPLESPALSSRAGRARGDGGAAAMGSGSGFQFSELLSTNDQSSFYRRAAEDARKHDMALEQLRADNRDLRIQLAEAKNELREAMLMEEKQQAQMNLLKDQLREEEASRARSEQFRENGDYAKNVILKFLISEGNPLMRKNLVPVICRVLNLSEKEKKAVEGVYMK